jgi:hypothetical protein
MNFAGEQVWQEYTHELPKDVTEWDKIQKPNRVKPAFPLEVILDFRLQRVQVCEQVAMGETHSPRFGGGAGRKNDLDQVVRVNRLSWNDTA